jgi:hypothetical protein
MANKINKSTLEAAEALNEVGDIAGAYRVLDEAGDKYAANEKRTHLFLEAIGECYAKEGESIGAKLSSPYIAERS